MSSKQWKALVVLALSLGFTVWSVWPAQAGSSTKVNLADRADEDLTLTTFTDDTAYTPATSDLTVIGAQADDAATDSVDEGDAGALRMSLDRRLLVDSDVAVIVPGTGATNLGKAEDAAHTSADTGVMLLAVRDDTPPTATGANGDYVPLLTSGTGELYVTDDEGRATASSGQHLDNAGGGTAADTNYSVTVVASATYRVHAVNGVIYLGIADATTDANVLWIVGAGHTEKITIPSGTSLNYFVDTAGVEGRLARIK